MLPIFMRMNCRTSILRTEATDFAVKNACKVFERVWENFFKKFSHEK